MGAWADGVRYFGLELIGILIEEQGFGRCSLGAEMADGRCRFGLVAVVEVSTVCVPGYLCMGLASKYTVEGQVQIVALIILWFKDKIVKLS